MARLLARTTVLLVAACWDIAAGGLLVREAGGRTLDQRPDGPFVCGSVTIFDELLGRLGLID